MIIKKIINIFHSRNGQNISFGAGSLMSQLTKTPYRSSKTGVVPTVTNQYTHITLEMFVSAVSTLKKNENTDCL